MIKVMGGSTASGEGERCKFCTANFAPARGADFEPKVVQISARNTKVYKICMPIFKMLFPAVVMDFVLLSRQKFSL